MLRPLTWHCPAVLLGLLQSGLQAAVSALRRPELLAHLLQSLLQRLLTFCTACLEEFGSKCITQQGAAKIY